jgi:hypothetical protein
MLRSKDGITDWQRHPANLEAETKYRKFFTGCAAGTLDCLPCRPPGGANLPGADKLPSFLALLRVED